MSFRKRDKVYLYGGLTGFRTNESGEACPIFSGVPCRVVEARERRDGFQNVKVRVLRHKCCEFLTWESGASGWAHSVQLTREKINAIKALKEEKLCSPLKKPAR
jgi:hypothetical protein